MVCSLSEVTRFHTSPRRERNVMESFLSREFQNGLLGFLWRRWVNQLQIIHFNDRLVVCEGRVKIDKTALSGQLLKVLCFMWD